MKTLARELIKNYGFLPNTGAGNSVAYKQQVTANVNALLTAATFLRDGVDEQVCQMCLHLWTLSHYL